MVLPLFRPICELGGSDDTLMAGGTAPPPPELSFAGAGLTGAFYQLG